MTEQFITFRDLDGQAVCMNIRHIITVVCPSLINGEPNGMVFSLGVQAKVSVATARKLQDALTTVDVEKTEVQH